MATIHINRRDYHTQASSLTGVQILEMAGIGPDHDLFLLQGEGDRSGGTPISPTELVPIRDGEHFRAIPGNRNFG